MRHALAIAFALCGCSGPNPGFDATVPPPAARHDLALVWSEDGGMPADDGAAPAGDLAELPDLAVPADVAQPRDLVPPLDLILDNQHACEAPPFSDSRCMWSEEDRQGTLICFARSGKWSAQTRVCDCGAGCTNVQTPGCVQVPCDICWLGPLWRRDLSGVNCLP